MAEEYELGINPKDIGEIVEIIRIQYLKMNDETFCHKLGISPKTLLTVENGKGPHGVTVMKKINEAFPKISVKLLVEIS